MTAEPSILDNRPFRKMNGLGNDFIIVDLRGQKDRPTAEAVTNVSNRATGIGCDQFIAITDGPADSGAAKKDTNDTGRAFMDIWNVDGSKAGACGNAARCVALILMDEQGSDDIVFDTPSGPLTGRRVTEGPRAGAITVDMGPPRFEWDAIPLSEPAEDTRFVDVKLGPIDAPVLWGPSALSMGNPHCVFFVEDAEAQALDRFGPLVEHHPLFPEGVNVSVAEAVSSEQIRLRVWERGVGITKACGTAACATLVAANRRRLTGRSAEIVLDGGSLWIEWVENDHVLMTGPTELEFEGVLDVSAPTSR
ncbi:MAG: diaminopimelate epimerase [Pseudomonadota bacterium]